MSAKTLSLYFYDSNFIIELENQDDDMVLFTIKQMEINQAKSTKDKTHYEVVNTTDIYFDAEDADSLMNALHFIIPKE